MRVLKSADTAQAEVFSARRAALLPRKKKIIRHAIFSTPAPGTRVRYTAAGLTQTAELTTLAAGFFFKRCGYPDGLAKCARPGKKKGEVVRRWPAIPSAHPHAGAPSGEAFSVDTAEEVDTLASYPRLSGRGPIEGKGREPASPPPNGPYPRLSGRGPIEKAGEAACLPGSREGPDFRLPGSSHPGQGRPAISDHGLGWGREVWLVGPRKRNCRGLKSSPMPGLLVRPGGEHRPARTRDHRCGRPSEGLGRPAFFRSPHPRPPAGPLN